MSFSLIYFYHTVISVKLYRTLCVELTVQGFFAGENTELGEDFGMVVCADDLELLHKLDQAAKKGDTRKKHIISKL